MPTTYDRGGGLCREGSKAKVLVCKPTGKITIKNYIFKKKKKPRCVCMSSDHGGGESKTPAPRPRRASRQTTLDAFANFRHHTEKLSRLASKGKTTAGEEAGGAPAAPVAAWGTEEEVEAEEEWDDNHPLKFWVPDTPSLAPWLGTPGEWITGIFEEAAVTRDDVVCDIGCGDGHPHLAAQLLHCRVSIGIELGDELVGMAVSHARRRLGDGYESLGLRFIHGDAMEQDLSAVTVLVVTCCPTRSPYSSRSFASF